MNGNSYVSLHFGLLNRGPGDKLIVAREQALHGLNIGRDSERKIKREWVLGDADLFPSLSLGSFRPPVRQFFSFSPKLS